LSFSGVVVAAGAGVRFGRTKHDQELCGRPLWQWARDALDSAGAVHVVVVGPVPGGVAGGERRRDSVAAGIAALGSASGLVLVHDAARPLASAGLVRRVVARLETGDVDGVVPALAVRSTLKRVVRGVVRETVDRDGLFEVQTPQGFRIDVLRRAHAADDEDATDDAVLVERIGGTVATVPGDPANLKVTYPDDLAMLAALVD
jgi:2-C-methyl-D-erythritol 4-phosphate cytidylyltransferase